MVIQLIIKKDGIRVWIYPKIFAVKDTINHGTDIPLGFRGA
jgi:hypothetical protein